MKSITLRALALVGLLAPSTFADDPFVGFKFTSLPNPIPGAVSRTLSNRDIITFDGQSVQRWRADGLLLADLVTFPQPDFPGAMVIADDEATAVVAQRDGGAVFQVDLNFGGAILVGSIPNSYDAVFEDPTHLLFNAALCGSGCGGEIIRLDTQAGTRKLLAVIDGQPGPMTRTASGDVLIGTVSGEVPMPTDSSQLLRVTPGQLVEPFEPIFIEEPEQNGIIVFEAEAEPAVDFWSEENDAPGFLGTSFYRWDGPDLFGTPGIGVLTYTFEVSVGGNYQLRIHNMHDDPDTSMENDCWGKMDDGPWDKLFSNLAGISGIWNWSAKFGESHIEANYDLDPGIHTFYVSGRSNDYRFDRVHIWLTGTNGTQNPAFVQSRQVAVLQSDMAVEASGFDGLTSIALDEQWGNTYLGTTNPDTGTNRIHRLSSDFIGDVVMVEGDPFETITGVQITEGPGNGFYFPMQPANNGRMIYRKSDPPANSFDDRIALDTLRPTIDLTGPGTTGFGLVNVAVRGGWPNGIILMLLGPAPLYNPLELTLPWNGLPLLHLGLDLFTLAGPIALPLNADGELLFSFDNIDGVTNALAMQGVMLNTSLQVVGTSGPGIL